MSSTKNKKKKSTKKKQNNKVETTKIKEDNIVDTPPKSTKSTKKQENKIEEKSETLVQNNQNEVAETEVKVKEKASKKRKSSQKNKTSKAEEENIQNNEITEKKEKSQENKSDEEEKNIQQNKSDEKEKSILKNELNENEKNVQNNKNDEKKEEKPEYVLEMLKNKKIKMYIFVISVVLILLLIVFSTSFALFNLNNINIIKGVSVKGIELSNLNIEDAKLKLDEGLKKELIPEITLKYGDYNKSFTADQIEYTYKIDDAIEIAYNTGRDNNIVKNNYTLIFTNIFGKNIPIEYTYNEDLLNQFIDGVSAEIPGVVIEPSYYIEDSKLIINQGTDGIQVEKDELKKQILNTIFKRKNKEITDGFKQEIEIPVKETKASEIDLDKIYSEIHTEPKDAYFETNPYKIYPDVDGVDLAISLDEAKNIIKSERKQEYSLDLNITKASKTINDLGTEAFPYLVSSFSTKYDASNTNRSTNLAIAANKINGKVLMPGEEFSYNQVVGKRTVEEGYRDAAIYQDGAVVDGLAGGICQISSTLYNAVLLANLEVTERMNHSYTTSYVAAGRDATVVWGTKDFKFKNTRTYPIKIEASVKNGIAEFKIHGVEEEKEYEIRILPVTTASIPYSTSYIQDPALAPGQQIVSQYGHPGYKVTTYKEVRYNGEVISKDIISNDTYKPMQTIIRTGPNVAPPAPEPAPVQ